MTATQSITSTDLTPGPGITPAACGFAVREPHVRLSADAPLEPGWYEIRLAVKSADRFTIRKRLELTFDPADSIPRAVAREAFAWNREFSETFMLRLSRPVAGVRLDLWHAQGELTLDSFRVRPVSAPKAIVRAVREKVRLTRAYRCFGSALLRGGRMLARGRFREFGKKLYKGLTDARIMQIGLVRLNEVDGGWSRRNALPHDEAEAVRTAVDAMTDPPAVAVLLPVQPEKFDAARLSAHSVRRQIYPHWQLLVAMAGPSDLAKQVDEIIGPDSRVIATRVPKSSGVQTAFAKVLAATDCEHVVVLPPGVELAEHALYHLAAELQRNPDTDAIGVRVAGASEAAVWLARVKRLSDAVPTDFGREPLAAWAAADARSLTLLDPVLAYPIDDRPLLDRTRLGKPPTPRPCPLFLSADIRGIGGYDQVAFAFLKGLASVGLDVRMHHQATIRHELVPPDLLRPYETRRLDDPQLVMGPPFLVPRFGLDAQSVVYTMWETDRLQPEWVKLLNKARAIIVPSQWQVECFRESGITVPMDVAPLGFDPLVYHPVGPMPDVCTFGTAGALTSGGMRKNAQTVIDLFRREFPTEPDVRLRVKITPGSPGVETYDDPRIDVIRAILPLGEMADWYRSLTAYVNGSSGEGFGLHLIEAMACGRPVVTPCHSGLTAYFDASVGYPVEFKLVPVKNEIYTGHWAEPDERSMAEQLRRVYTNPDEARRYGLAAANRAKRFTWKAGGQALVRALRKYQLID